MKKFFNMKKIAVQSVAGTRVVMRYLRYEANQTS